MEFYLSAIIQALAFLPLAFGIFLSVKIFNIPDITTDGSYTLGAAVSAIMTVHHIHPLVILPLSIMAGAFAGSLTGIIHTKLKVNALLSGILMMTALYSINLLIMQKSNIPLINTENIFTIFNIHQGVNMQFVTCLTIVIILIVLLGYLLMTDFGLTMRATGSNEEMIRAQGVNTDKIKIIGLAISNGLVALSGTLVTQLQGFADINMGIGIVIAGLASVMIGDSLAILFKSRSIFLQLLMVLCGTLIFRLLLAQVLALGIPQVYIKLLTATLVLVFLSFTRLKWSTFNSQKDA